VEDGKLAVSGRMDVEFERVCAKREGGFHRGYCVFEEGMARRQHAIGSARFRSEIRAVEILGKAAMRKHRRDAFRTARQQRGVVEPDATRSDKNCNERDRPFAHDVIPIDRPVASCPTIGLFDGMGQCRDREEAGKQRETADYGPPKKFRGGRRQRRNHYGCNLPNALVLAMRYVIVISAVTFFLIWDAIYNHGQYLDRTVREVTRAVQYVTSLV
jgi:hypothetical protein